MTGQTYVAHRLQAPELTSEQDQRDWGKHEQQGRSTDEDPCDVGSPPFIGCHQPVGWSNDRRDADDEDEEGDDQDRDHPRNELVGEDRTREYGIHEMLRHTEVSAPLGDRLSAASFRVAGAP